MLNSYDANKTPWRVAAITLVCLCSLYVSIVQTNGVDFWLQARIGEIIASERIIPDTLLFPFTEISEQHFNAHEWLPSIIFHVLLKSLGESRLPFFTSLLGLAYLTITARLAFIRGGGNFAFAIIGGILALVTENYRHVLRPELLSLLLMATYWIVLERFRRRPNFTSVLQAALLTALWANSHGSFVLAPALAGLYATGTHIDTMRNTRNFFALPSEICVKLALFGAAILGASLINPFGLDLIRFVLEFSNTTELQLTLVEWMPTFSPVFYKAPGVWLGASVALLTLIVLIADCKRTEAAEWLVFFFFAWLAFKAIRFPVYLGLVAAWIIPAHIPERWKNAVWQRHLHQSSCLIALLTVGLAMRFGNAHGHFPYTPGVSKLSDGMVEVISNPIYKGNVYTSLELGSELVYRAYPRLRPSIDCRIDSYGLDYLQFQKALLYNNNLLVDFIRRYDVRYILVDQGKFQLLQRLDEMQNGKWHILYMDRNAVFLQRLA